MQERDWTLPNEIWDVCLVEQVTGASTDAHRNAALDVLEMWLPKMEKELPIGKPPTVLDVGCGPAMMREVLTSRGWLWYGIDCVAGGENIALGDFHFISLPTCFDLVYCRHVVEHSPMPLLAMQKLYEFTRPGGWCLIITPTPPWYADYPGHYSVMCRTAWISLARRIGFTVDTVAEKGIEDGSTETRMLLRRVTDG